VGHQPGDPATLGVLVLVELEVPGAVRAGAGECDGRPREVWSALDAQGEP
jgi:hypothetical protein